MGEEQIFSTKCPAAASRYKYCTVLVLVLVKRFFVPIVSQCESLWLQDCVIPICYNLSMLNVIVLEAARKMLISSEQFL
jgi:hypothetical protein